MISEIFNDWRYEDAELLKTDVRGTEYDPVDVAEAAERAKNSLGIKTRERSGYIIPLFAVDDPIPTNQYIIFKPETDQIGWYDSGFGVSGTQRFTDCERVNTTEIGQRLRFWLPSNQPQAELEVDESKLPDERIRPSDRLSDAEQREFFEELKQFVRSEREAERESNWETYADIELEEAIRRNRVSGPFVKVGGTSGSNGKPAYLFQIVEDEEEEDDQEIDLRGDEGIFEGNHCIVDIVADGEQFPIEVEVLSIDGPNLTIQPKWDSIDSQATVNNLFHRDGSEIWIHELLNPVPFDRRLAAIRQVEQNADKRDLLTGKRLVEFSVNKYALPDSRIDLNEYQRMALIWADSANDVVCIHGPPGTGKTRTLTAYVKHAVSKGQSVLVSAHSNQAVDNLLVGDSTPSTPEEDTLHDIAQDSETDLSIARVGNNSRNTVVQANYADQPISGADVVAATTSGASTFDPNSFDVAVVDEATQASRPATAIVLNSARKIVLAGDHKQLPPYCANESMQEEDMHISLFEYLLNRYDDETSVLLQKQYRMNKEIAEFPNKAIYNGNLETAVRNQEWTVDDLKPIIGINIAGDERRETHGDSFYNTQEAETVAKQVRLLVQSGLNTEDIGVITAYSGQIGEIGSRINQLNIENPRSVSVDTVDSFQGSEREAIIVSFVRSNSEGHSGFLEFPEEGPRRLNVALTRARKRLVLVGNWDTLGTVAPHRSPDESCAPLYADLAEYIQSQEKMLALNE